MYDYIIVGQGIAGSVLALSLLKEGKKIIVIDSPYLSSSSKIAAGLYNPVVFKRMVKSWKADELIPLADKFYEYAEHIFKNKFHYKKNIIKLFVNEQEKELWLKKSAEDDGSYLSKTIHTGLFHKCIRGESGYAEVLQSGYLDVKCFLEEVKKHLLENNLLREEIFDHALIQHNENEVEYKNIKTRKLIFCEGYRATENPYFNYLPFKLTKGELLTVRIKNLTLDKVINKGVFIVPLGNDLFKVGATYEWNEINETVSEKGKNELKEKLEKVLDIPFEIIEHKAGVRPTVNDRRPLLGIHPEYNNLAIFNGMGTKAVMLAPYFASQFINHIEKKSPLDKEVDIKRFE